MFLEECKYIVKEKKIPKYIINDIEIYSDSDRESSDEENSDKETFDEETSDEENSDEKNSNEENYFFFLCIKMINNFYQKTKKSLKKNHVKGTKIFLKKKKTNRANMLVSDRNPSEEEKEKKRQYDCEQYKNLLEDEYKNFFLGYKK